MFIECAQCRYSVENKYQLEDVAENIKDCILFDSAPATSTQNVASSLENNKIVPQQFIYGNNRFATCFV